MNIDVVHFFKSVSWKEMLKEIRDNYFILGLDVYDIYLMQTCIQYFKYWYTGMLMMFMNKTYNLFCGPALHFKSSVHILTSFFLKQRNVSMYIPLYLLEEYGPMFVMERIETQNIK